MPVPTSPYDSCTYVLNIARSLGNDAIQSLAGNLLNDNQPYVPVYLNSGYRYLQRKLANSGYATFKKTIQIFGVPVAAYPDPGLQVALSYTGFFNGQINFEFPTLPADLCWPLWLKERQSGTRNLFQKMWPANDGLMSRPQGIWLRDWVWANDQIQMNGATQVNDLQMLYVPFLPELSLNTTPVSQVLIVRSENALASYILAEWAMARGSPLAGDIRAMGDAYVKEMLASDAMQKQRRNVRRRSYSQTIHTGWSWF